MLKKWIYRYWVYCVIVALCFLAITRYENYLKEHNEALMVLITAVYLFATIKISSANIESANAAREQMAVTQAQIDEEKKQYEETKHLQVLPVFKYPSNNKASAELLSHLAPRHQVFQESI